MNSSLEFRDFTIFHNFFSERFVALGKVVGFDKDYSEKNSYTLKILAHFYNLFSQKPRFYPFQFIFIIFI